MAVSDVIRPMRPDDAGAVAGLSRELGYPATAASVRRRIRTLAGRADAGIFVAQDSLGRVIGWVHIYGVCLLESESHAEIGGLVVGEQGRRRGAGRALAEAAATWAAHHGYETVRVRSNVTRVQARRFYEHLGYRHVKTQNVFWKALEKPVTT